MGRGGHLPHLFDAAILRRRHPRRLPPGAHPALRPAGAPPSYHPYSYSYHPYSYSHAHHGHALTALLSDLQAQLEALLSSAAQRRYLRAHPATADFRRRFNLPIYFQLRVQEVGRLLDAVLLPRGTPLAAAAAATPPPPAAGGESRALVLPPPPPPTLSTAAALALVEAVRLCFSPAVLLRPLSARFLRLALQTVTRFGEWVLSLPPPTTVAAEPAPAATPPPAAAAPAAAPAAAAAGTAHGASQAEGGGEGDCLLYVGLHLDVRDCLAWLRALAPLLPALIGLDDTDAAATAATHPASTAASLGGECSAALLEASESLAAADDQLRTALVGRRVLPMCSWRRLQGGRVGLPPGHVASSFALRALV